MNSSVVMDPLLPIWAIAALTVLIIASALFGQWKGLNSLILRAIAAFMICGALLNPQKLLEDRQPLPDIALIITDNTESMDVAGRSALAADINSNLLQKLGALGNIEIIENSVGPSEYGTRLTQSLVTSLGELPADRIAGVFAITDGQVHDLPNELGELLPDGVPFHAVIAGDPNARDRRLDAIIAPRFGMVGEQAEFKIRIEDPGHNGERAPLEIRLNGEIAARFNAIIGDDITLPLNIEKRGINTVEIRAAIVPDAEGGELTPLNNVFVAEMSGVRDRLRVLLITGEPHMGGRAWRNLLKSDPSVDLVQFTILTNPGEKVVNASQVELSLIEFPVRELFEEKLTEFDLVIFDQFKQRTLRGSGRTSPMLHPVYISNISKYVEKGGALLIAAGPSFAGDDSLARSPLIAVLPARPTGDTAAQAFRPKISEKGSRHPITSIFAGETAARWGRWYRSIEANIIGGDVLMENDEGAPLLVIDKVEDGRVALLLSDQAWLWSKNHDGGGPYNEMFRRLGHWLMSEPDLEADRLTARVENGALDIQYFSLDDEGQSFEILLPDGSSQTIASKRAAPGQYRATLPADIQGAYRVTAGDLSAITAAGALNPAEFKHVSSTADILAPLSTLSGGGVYFAQKAAGAPEIRRVRAGAKASDENWAGVISHEQYTVTASRRTPIGPTWLYFLIIIAALLGAWRFESR